MKEKPVVSGTRYFNELYDRKQTIICFDKTMRLVNIINRLNICKSAFNPMLGSNAMRVYWEVEEL